MTGAAHHETISIRARWIEGDAPFENDGRRATWPGLGVEYNARVGISEPEF